MSDWRVVVKLIGGTILIMLAIVLGVDQFITGMALGFLISWAWNKGL